MRLTTIFFSVIILVLECSAMRAQVTGCTDPLATNFNSMATVNDGSCLYPNTNITPVSTFVLDSTLDETSGLILWNNYLWTQNDDTDKNIYALDTVSGTVVLSQLVDSAVTNIDWEEISQDADYLYIGDFGNNQNGNRTNLKIFRLNKNSVLAGQPVIDTILFAYSDQTNFNPAGPNNTDFDCEAMVVDGDSIFLFTKQYVSMGTKVYSLPKTPGSWIANYRYGFNVQGLITGATYLADSRLLALCGYSNTLQPFLWCFYDFDSTGFFSGNKRKLNISLPFHQIEGIATGDGIKFYATNEFFTQPPIITTQQKLHIFDLSAYLQDYLNSLTAINSSYNSEPQISIFPIPAANEIQIFNPGVKNSVLFSIYDDSGKVVLTGNLKQGSNKIDISKLRTGTYVVKAGNRYAKKFSLQH